MESNEQVAKVCSRCGENFASTGQAWCRKCRTDHERQRVATQQEMAAGKRFQDGANALRYQLAKMFARAPGATFEGQSIAKYIMEFPPPPYDEKKEPPTGAGG